MILGILDCDELSPFLRADYKSYGEMFKRLLIGEMDDLELRVYSVLENEYPSSIAECDAYLLTGSKVGVYDSQPWLVSLRDFVNRAYESHVPLVGICFGHQMIAHSLGGLAQKSELGWGIGALSHRLIPTEATPAWMENAPDQLCLLYSHQDQVVRLPEGAHALYGSHFCPNGAFHIPGRVLAFQGHPEFTLDYSARLMHSRQERYLPGQYEHAMDSLTRTIDNDLVAHWIKRFISGDKT